MKEKIKEEVENHKLSSRRRSSHHNQDIVKVLKELESKDFLLKQNEKELLEKTKIIISLENTVSEVKKNLKKKSEDFADMQKRKDETIKQLENSYFD